MALSIYSGAMLLLSPALAITFSFATWLLLRHGRNAHQVRRRAGSILWTAHAAAYWTANAILRLWFGYSTPTLGMSSWAAIIFIHAAFSMLWMAALLLRYESSPDSDE